MEEQEEEGFSVPKSTNERNSVSPVKLDNIEDSGFSSIVGSVEGISICTIFLKRISFHNYLRLS